MDYEKLVEQMKWWAEECDRTNFGCQAKKTLQEAATALSMLQAENEKLRAELDEKEKYYDQMIDALAATNSTELEQVKRERDAAIEAANGLDKMISRAWGED
mgnify:CR=1 FL=1|jgi:hypothetical protein